MAITSLIMIMTNPIIIVTSVQDAVYLTAEENQIQILFLMDHDYGANYHFIRPILESYGWNITIAGTNGTLQPCSYQTSSAILEVDLLISEVVDVTGFDAISIMPGNSYNTLRTSPTAHNIIDQANDAEMVVSAWCKGVRVLAAADVIDGKNVTGNGLYQDEYEAAGATYLGIVPPVIDGNIVTGVRSRHYREHMCRAIATALGVFEGDAPEISNAHINGTFFEPDTEIGVSVDVVDQTGIRYVYVSFYPYSYELNNRTSEFATKTVLMTMGENNLTYSATPSIGTKNNYTVDFRVVDVFENEVTNSDVLFVEIDDIPVTPTTSSTTQPTSTVETSTSSSTSTSTPEPTNQPIPMEIVVIGTVGGIGLVVVLVVLLKRR